MAHRIAIIGCGTAGLSSALLLVSQGHTVSLFESVSEPGPIGAGILLQPTGLYVLHELGLLPGALAHGALVHALDGRNRRGSRIMHLEYADFDARLYGLGVHRGNLFKQLYTAVQAAGISVSSGVEITAIDTVAGARQLSDSNDNQYGPFDAVIIANGTQSLLRRSLGVRQKTIPYPWGALWAVCPDEQAQFAGTLSQVYRNTDKMIGVLPTGLDPHTQAPCVSLFWSLQTKDYAAWQHQGLAPWKQELLQLWPQLLQLLATINDSSQLAFATYSDVRLRTWHDGNLVCLGDAAHGMSPQLGQGANMALYDAYILADCLARHTQPSQAFAAYSRERKRHLRYYQLASRWLTPLFQSSLTWLGPVRDMSMGMTRVLPFFYQSMLSTLIGTQTGLFSRLPRARIETMAAAIARDTA